MMLRLKKILPVLIVVLQIGTTLFDDFGHTDVVYDSFGSVQKLVTHDCGARERHKSLNDVLPCMACYRAQNFVAGFTASFCPSQFISGSYYTSLFSFYSSTHFDYSCPDRGPPLFS